METPNNFWFSSICNLSSITTEERQGNSALTGRSKWLLGMLRTCKDVHKRAVPSILEALDELMRQVENEKIAIADSKEQEIFYGKRYILASIATSFDPLLVNLMPSGSSAYCIANSIDGLFPLSRSLSKRENCRSVADNIDQLSRQIKSFSSYELDQEIVLRESLHCIRGVLDAVHNVLPTDTLNWCDYCFRRAPINSNYCDIHNPSNDTDYRMGKRIRNTLSEERLNRRTKYWTARRALGESFNLVSQVEDIAAAISSDPSIIVPEQIKQLSEQTISNWASARVTWAHIIEKECPSLLKIISTNMPGAHNSWQSWTSAIRIAYKDELEHTTHPYWILNILGCAEDWFTTESDATDRRKTDIQERIKALWAAGTTNTREIAEQLKISRQYVSRVIKRLDLRK